jgi:hypothetical protein
MSTTSDLRRLEHIVAHLSGDKALLDEAKEIVRRMIDAQASTSATAGWWDTYGPEKEWRPGIPLSPKPRELVDLIVTSGASPLNAVAATLGIDEAYARRLVSRTDTELLDRGGKATISISAGMVHTATTPIVVGPAPRER